MEDIFPNCYFFNNRKKKKDKQKHDRAHTQENLSDLFQATNYLSFV